MHVSKFSGQNLACGSGERAAVQVQVHVLRPAGHRVVSAQLLLQVRAPQPTATLSKALRSSLLRACALPPFKLAMGASVQVWQRGCHSGAGRAPE